MNLPLHAIERACNPVPGSLAEIAVVDPDDLVTQPVWWQLPTISDLDFKPGRSAFLLEADRFTGTLSGDTETSAAPGDIFTYSLSGRLKRIRLDVEYLRAKLMHRRVHIVATYTENTKKFVPNMRLKFFETSGDSYFARNTYTIGATTRLDRPAPIFDGELSVVGGSESGGSGSTDGTGTAPTGITTSNSSYTYNLPAGKLLIAIYLISTNAQTVKIGLTSGGYELGGPVYVPALSAELFGAAQVRGASGGTPIYFSGLAGTNTIEIWTLG